MHIIAHSYYSLSSPFTPIYKVNIKRIHKAETFLGFIAGLQIVQAFKKS